MTFTPSENYVLVLTATAGAVTILLRSVPFLLFGHARRPPPAFIPYLGRVLAPASIAMLVVYCFATYFAERPPLAYPYAAPELLAGTLAVLLQFWRRNPLLSIIASTALYMLLLHVF
ncbi:MAG: AzlD domain-containing protein [Kiritimatiellae bacterium]|nr:AzlD domain-containing protein [Kiritimatiellia bacterium]MBQ9345474.1 AzlD domain-containing protein [Kiritimatiellia bacterium]